ncbi:type II toxin-antitoxin system PemK/MazF family toxin [Streptomyces sp. TG1A-60]|uniref:type II toxin-antitoxin system PemK/MazF family toxin n=1 Tax=Streptomyces sp. TG1A-60 TaxID=3129111 RepID=UPI0030CA914E
MASCAERATFCETGDIWTLDDGRSVLIISLDGLEGAYGAVLAIMLHPVGRYPDTAMSVAIENPLACTAVAVNIQQLRTTHFDEAKRLGSVEPAVMERVSQALRAVLDL